MGSSRRGALRHLVQTAMVALLLVASVGCSEDSTGTDEGPGPASPPSADATHGPFFPECGGVSDQTIAQLTQVTGLVNTARNSVGCQWLVNGLYVGPSFSFTWYRGSPIGRERKNEELTRASVVDTSIEGHDGWIAIGNDATLGDYLCEIAVGFSDDFIEWSVSFSQKPFPDPCEVAEELTRQSIAASR